jgi:hypothetical protein
MENERQEYPPGSRLGEFFSIEEFEVTSTGLDNRIPLERRGEVGDALTELVLEVLDPLRRASGAPIIITSGFRTPEVNKAVRGSSSSLHLEGWAADFRSASLTGRELVGLVLELGLPFDQVIWYHKLKGGHVHLHMKPWSHDAGGELVDLNRRQVLYCNAQGSMQRQRIDLIPA